MSYEDWEKVKGKCPICGKKLEGWHKYNPNDYHCEECGSGNIEFMWYDGEVKGFQCNDCGDTALDKG